MQRCIKAYFSSRTKASHIPSIESVSTSSQASIELDVALKLPDEAAQQNAETETKDNTAFDKETMCGSPRDASSSSQETILAEQPEQAAVDLFEDDDSPVYRKRTLMFDETFVPDKVTCTEITEEFISSHLGVIEDLLQQGDADTSLNEVLPEQSLNNPSMKSDQTECVTSSASPTTSEGNGSPQRCIPSLGSLNGFKDKPKQGRLIRRAGRSQETAAEAPVKYDLDDKSNQGVDVTELCFNGAKNEKPDASKITVGKEKFRGLSQSSDCVTDEERKMYLNCPASRKSKCFKAYVEHYYRYNETFVFPTWVHIKEIRDKEGRKPTDEDYDPSTLWVPSKNHRWAIEYRSCHFTECMQQWWYLKQERFDQLLFFKMGRFYELFYHDACIIQEICNLRWMGSENKPHVGFPEKSLHYYALACVSRGYKVVVIEQTETPQQLEKRNKETGQRHNTVSRAICEIITPGTIVRPEMLEVQSKELLLISEACVTTKGEVTNDQDGAATNGVQEPSSPSSASVKRPFGNFRRNRYYNMPLTLDSDSPGDRLLCVCSMDVSIGSVSFGLIDVSLGVNALRDLIYAINPSEVVVDSAALSSFEDVHAMTNHMGFELTTFNCTEGNSSSDKEDKDPRCSNVDNAEFLERIKASLGDQEPRYKRLVLLLQRYLKSVMLDNLLNYCTIGKLDSDHKRCMVLDGAALSQLELFTSQEGDDSLSLFGFLNKTRSPIGQRMLRRWLLKPLLCARSINERSATVDFLRLHFSVCSVYQDKIASMPDLERSFGKVLNAAAGCYKQAVYFDNDVFVKLYELYQLLENFKKMESHVSDFFQEISRLPGGGTPLLANMATVMVKVMSHCQELLSMLHISGQKTCSSNAGSWEPSDEIRKKIDSVTDELNSVLSEIKKTCPSAMFVHTKFRYEVELPEREYKRLTTSNKTLEVTSTRAGFVRVRNDEILSLLEKLEEEEFALTQSELSFFQHVVKLLHQKRTVFNTLLSTAAELDCLCSLAAVAKNATIPMVRAEVLEHGKGEPYMFIKDSTHPMVCQMNPETFVPNDVKMGTDDYKTLLLLTGPNMGGKSTLLRQTALCAIMAQMGSFVSANECKMTAVDRIFTRLGASDNLIQGKSTFLVELEEVSSLLRSATKDSLVLVDELGRGTSTFDATAIAAASLEKISSIGSRCLFTTHFQEVCEYSAALGNVSLCHMTASLDDEERTLVFLYKLALGQCPESHGIHVAKLAGIPEDVITMARKVSRKFRMQKVPPTTLLSALKDAHQRGDVDTLRKLYEQHRELYGGGNYSVT